MRSLSSALSVSAEYGSIEVVPLVAILAALLLLPEVIDSVLLMPALLFPVGIGSIPLVPALLPGMVDSSVFDPITIRRLEPASFKIRTIEFASIRYWIDLYFSPGALI